MDISNKDREKLYRKVKVELGYPTVDIEIEDKTLDTLLDVSIEDYSEYLNNWLIKQKWGELQNLNKASDDIKFALMTKTLDWEREFSYAYSKQVELGSGGRFPEQWTLETDYITITGGTQLYEIPENREVTTVLWVTPPQIGKTAFRNSFGTWNNGLNNIGGSIGMTHNSLQSTAMLPMYSTLLLGSDISMRENIFLSPMTYRITQKGKNKLLWLYPVPGSRYEIGQSSASNFTKTYDGYRIYYYYYDVSINRDECIEQNNDHIYLPSDVDIESLKWSQLNSPSKNTVRRILTAQTKRHIGLSRGKFNGELKFGDSQLTMDYRILLEQGTDELKEIYTELKEMLENYEYDKIMEKRANIAKNLNEILSFIPSQKPIQIH